MTQRAAHRRECSHNSWCEANGDERPSTIVDDPIYQANERQSERLRKWGAEVNTTTSDERKHCRDCGWTGEDEDLVAAVPQPGADVEQVCPRCFSDYIEDETAHDSGK